MESLSPRSHPHPHRREFDQQMSLFKRDDCVACDGSTPTCDCASGEQCILTSRTCSECPAIQCIMGSSSSSSSGVNPGAIAGPIVAVLVIASLALFWWLRKKKKRDLARLEELATRARKAESAGFHPSQPSSPRPGSARSGSQRQYTASQLPAPPPSANSRRSPLPPAPVNADFYDENGASVRGNRGNGNVYAERKQADDGGPGEDPFADRRSVMTADSLATTQSANIIPIQWIPPSKSEDALASGNQPSPGGLSQAARTLDEARQNLFRPRQTPPPRPARSPDLNLRLSPPKDGISSRDPRTPGGFSAGQIRDSYLSSNSGSASFLSGNSYDIHSDAPKIVTSKQVQIGRLHQAEVVQFGKVELLGGHPRPPPVEVTNDVDSHLLPSPAKIPLSPSSGPGSAVSGGASGGSNLRTLTPTTQSFRTPDDVGRSRQSDGPDSASSTDLRFSMGSLAYNRDSSSTMGTSHPFGRPGSSAVRVPLPPAPDQRESMFSTKSYADSVLGGFPMIPPTQGSPMRTPGLPQSTSVSTLDHQATIPRPPPTYKPLTSFRPTTAGSMNPQRPGTAQSRPTTAVSVTDSFLGTFPFVPPNVDHPAGLPSATLPDTAMSRGTKSGRNTLGMSTTSEGLGGFDFSFEGAPPMPLMSPRKGQGQEKQ